MENVAVSQPEDSADREAERMAGGSQATRGTRNAGVGGAAAPPARRLAGLPSVVADTLRSPGVPLEPALREKMERRLAADFSSVRLRRDARAAESAAGLNARAYTVGEDVVFGRDAYAPDSSAGERLLAHELTHVLQQRAGAAASVATIQREENTEVDDIIVWHYINEAMERNNGSLWDAWGDLMAQRDLDPADPNLAAAEHYFTARFITKYTPLPSFFVADMAMGYGLFKDFMRDEVGLDPSFSEHPTTKSSAGQVKYGMWGAFDSSWWAGAWEAIFD